MATQDFRGCTEMPGISIEAFKQIAPGDTITYLLAPEMFPTNAFREWHGRVQVHNQQGWVTVAVLDEGYVGETEVVRRSEILHVTRSANSQRRL